MLIALLNLVPSKCVLMGYDGGSRDAQETTPTHVNDSMTVNKHYSLNSFDEALIPSVTVFGEGALKEVIKAK